KPVHLQRRQPASSPSNNRATARIRPHLHEEFWFRAVVNAAIRSRLRNTPLQTRSRAAAPARRRACLAAASSRSGDRRLVVAGLGPAPSHSLISESTSPASN